ncbi:hypothetical protein CCACVL1_26990, partial [Corchorus capsularis]
MARDNVLYAASNGERVLSKAGRSSNLK